MKVALVYDRINKWGGAERVLLALHAIWPQAPLFTAVYDPKSASWAKVFTVRTSFMQHMPLASGHHELYPWLTPLAFETFSFDEFDVVISVTSAEAKSIITKPETIHICYCLTPTRYLWSGYEQYQKAPGMGSINTIAKFMLTGMAPALRRWDLVSSSRPDLYLAISKRVAERIDTYYHRKTDAVIYPPIDFDKFPLRQTNGTGEYFLVVSRLVGYKRLDVIIDAFNTCKKKLVIIGDGLAKSELMKKANLNIKFLSSYLTDKELVRYYQNCRALVIAADEDLGLTAIEAQACGKPVIGFRQSGISEIVEDGMTGILFDAQTADSLLGSLKRFDSLRFNETIIRKRAERFDIHTFKIRMEEKVKSIYNHRRIL